MLIPYILLKDWKQLALFPYRRMVKMNRSFFIFGIIAILAVWPILGESAAEAGCHPKAGCFAEDDTGPNPLCSTDEYDPCDSWINYSIDFYRTAQTGNSNSIKFSLTGSMWIRYIYAYQYEQGWHNESGNYYVGASSSHTLRMDKQGTATGNFTDISVEINYVADDPTR